MGNSESAQVGDWVLAIGSPFGFSPDRFRRHRLGPRTAPSMTPAPATSTAASSSASSRPTRPSTPATRVARWSTWPDRSSAWNTAIYTQSAGSEGVGFAMPSNTLISVYNQLISPTHKVTRGSIGIQFQAMQSAAVGRMYGFANGGVFVSVVTPNGPAAKAGIQAFRTSSPPSTANPSRMAMSSSASSPTSSPVPPCASASCAPASP